MRSSPGHGRLTSSRRAGRAAALQALAAVVLSCLFAARGIAQVGPVYPDDSVAAREGLARAQELAAAGNGAEAVRVIQATLVNDGDRVLESASDPELFVSVRSRAHAILLGDAALLAKYREIEGPEAQRALDAGEVDQVERSRLLTRAGLEAALRLAQEHLESARFEAARLTLEQLDNHPDRAADAKAGADAAHLAGALSRYLPRADVRDLVARWASQAGLPAAAGAEIVGPPVVQQYSPYSGVLPEAAMQGLIPRPIQSAWLSQDAQNDASEAQSRSDRRPNRFPVREQADEPWTIPTVRDDAVFTNDGRSIGAWDRYTLQPLWRVTPSSVAPGDYGNELLDAAGRFQAEARAAYRSGTILEDSNSVTLAGPLVVATTGLAGRDSRDGDPRTHAVDAVSGRVVWSVSPAGQDPQLAQAFVRGPALIEGDSVILALRKPNNSKRIASTFLVSLDLWTGRLRWTRLLGSAGWVWNAGARTAEVPILDRGIVYKSDDLGLIAAVEAWSGRVVWMRRFRSETRARTESSPPWAGAAPIMDGDTVIAISPTRENIIRLDARTGAIKASRRAGELGDPLTLIRFGETLAALGEQIVLAPVSTFESASVYRAPFPKDARVRGRPVAEIGPSGARLLVPIADGNSGGGIVVIGGADGPGRVALETAGNVVVVGSHVLVADKGKLHSYLVWDVAEAVLNARMEKNPADPRPGMTLAELSYRSGRSALIAPAADRAIEAIKREPNGADAARSRSLLLDTLMNMVIATRESWPGFDEAGREPGLDPVLDPVAMANVLDRIERLAESPQERADYFMSLGRFAEASAQGIGGGKPDPAAGTRAVEAYQQVLEDPRLGASVWNSARGAVRAELEATRRVRDLVARLGRTAYRPFDASAQAQAAELSAQPAGVARAGRAENLARRYPASIVAPSMWALAAADFERAGETAPAMSALGAGLDAAEWCVLVGDQSQRAAVGELGGRLVQKLEADERVSAAAQLVDRLSRDHPGLVLTSAGQPIDAAGTLDELKRRIAGLSRRARIGTQFGASVQAIEGWTLVRPLSDAWSGRATEHVIMQSKARRELALWGAREDGTLVQLWSRSYQGGEAPRLVTLDAESAYLFWPADDGGRLERIGTVGGETRWKTPSFADSFPLGPAEAARSRREILTPLDGRVPATDLLLALDDQTAVIAERSGRVAAFDLATGSTRWAQSTLIEQVFDLDVGPGAGAGPGQNALVIAGVSSRAGVPGEGPTYEPAIAAYDLRTGKLMHQMSDLGSVVHWVRTTSSGGVIVGLGNKVASLNLPAGRSNWELNDSSARGTNAAWVVGDRVFVQEVAGGRRLWLASASSGQRRDLDVSGRLELPPLRAVATSQSPDAYVAFVSRKGVAVLGPTGDLVGLDPFNSAVELLAPEVGQDVMATIEAVRTSNPDSPSATLHLLESPGGRLIASAPVVMFEDPRELMLIDGHVLISCDSVTLSIPLPPERK